MTNQNRWWLNQLQGHYEDGKLDGVLGTKPNPPYPRVMDKPMSHDDADDWAANAAYMRGYEEENDGTV